MMTARPGGAGGSGGGAGGGGWRAAAIRCALLTAGGLAVAQAGPGITAIGPVRRALAPRLSGRGHAGHVALTFDDGPDPESTPRFLQVLADRAGRGTLFPLWSLGGRGAG